MKTWSNLSEPPLLSCLAERICAFDVNAATTHAIEIARTCILDTIGVTLAGIPEDCTRVLLATPGIASAPGNALIFGTDRRTSALEASLINGTASHALDFDDFSGVFGGHPSVPLVAPLFALAEERGLSGEQVLLAYIIGVETEIKLARAVHFHHYDKGWHPTSTLGVFGAAAAVSHLLRLDVCQTTVALAIAASSASGLKANFGTMTKPLHIGQCARDGLMAGLLAANGFDANPEALEHHQGFFEVFNGPGLYNADRLLANWGTPLEIDDPTIALKQFPCCGSMHQAIMMMFKLVREECISADDVVAIEIMPHERRLRHTNSPFPESPLEAKFSVQYVVARALLNGAVRLEHFEGEAHREPAVRRILDMTTAKPHPDMAADGPSQWGAEVIVTLADGRRFSRRVENLVGRGGSNAMSTQELWDKFEDCARRALPFNQIEPLFKRLQSLETVDDIGDITRLLEVNRPLGDR